MSVDVIISLKGHALICISPAGALSPDSCTESMLLEVDVTGLCMGNRKPNYRYACQDLKSSWSGMHSHATEPPAIPSLTFVVNPIHQIPILFGDRFCRQFRTKRTLSLYYTQSLD